MPEYYCYYKLQPILLTERNSASFKFKVILKIDAIKRLLHTRQEPPIIPRTVFKDRFERKKISIPSWATHCVILIIRQFPIRPTPKKSCLEKSLYKYPTKKIKNAIPFAEWLAFPPRNSEIIPAAIRKINSKLNVEA